MTFSSLLSYITKRAYFFLFNLINTIITSINVIGCNISFIALNTSIISLLVFNFLKEGKGDWRSEITLKPPFSHYILFLTIFSIA
nr:MAG TPA: hypothetical protein [Caudoviricetes sp.]